MRGHISPPCSMASWGGGQCSQDRRYRQSVPRGAARQNMEHVLDYPISYWLNLQIMENNWRTLRNLYVYDECDGGGDPDVPADVFWRDGPDISHGSVTWVSRKKRVLICDNVWIGLKGDFIMCCRECWGSMFQQGHSRGTRLSFLFYSATCAVNHLW